MSAVMRPRAPRLRPMRLADLPQVMGIEKKVYPFPWSEGIFRDCLRVGYFCQVLEGEEGLRGYGVMSVAADECHLLNISIHPDYQAQGLGKTLVNHLLDVARHYRARMAFLEVRESNHIARRLYEKIGFNEIGVRNRYYPADKGREDALILAMTL